MYNPLCRTQGRSSPLRGSLTSYSTDSAYKYFYRAVLLLDQKRRQYTPKEHTLLLHGSEVCVYRMAGKFSGEFNLVVWQIMNAPPN